MVLGICKHAGNVDRRYEFALCEVVCAFACNSIVCSELLPSFLLFVFVIQGSYSLQAFAFNAKLALIVKRCWLESTLGLMVKYMVCLTQLQKELNNYRTPRLFKFSRKLFLGAF